MAIHRPPGRRELAGKAKATLHAGNPKSAVSRQVRNDVLSGLIEESELDRVFPLGNGRDRR